MKQRFWYLLTRYLSKESSLEENEELKDIISDEQKYKRLFELHGGLWNEFIKNRSQSSFDRDKIKYKVLSNIHGHKTEKPKPSLRVWRYAAVIIFLLVSGYISYITIKNTNQVIESPAITTTTRANQRLMVMLKDGTEVWLQENSSITYTDELIREGERRVQLVGEAYFKVTKNAEFPFIVKTGEVYTRVLGTSFNVRAFPKKDVEITVETGKVRVENQVAKISLEPNEQAVIDMLTNDIQKQSVESRHVTVWKNPELTFDMVSLAEAFYMLGRYYNVKINIEGVENLSCPVRSKYENESLETVLQGLQLIFDIDYEIVEDKQIQITGSGCQTKK